ncbi:amino acid ABC transporter permease [Actinotalea sp. M2MS4P-6]|uniref:amino acid ABC transporter permease n=1 Tax=Actinotalea sp. M2MS4P-6 TaxID=2983762 RepID=UPI0021E50104|nr:amino acid ABC transporter permease [Actinotalea sp. M2MS4P-6]MCV2396033.1 amino acid ABC transporter permease [Actinotalea sp. M2MS4P-6]
MTSASSDARAALAARARMSPRRRAELSRRIQYGILIVLGLVIVVTTQWDRVAEVFLNPESIKAILPAIPRAALNTVMYTLGAFAVGLTLGTALALMKLSSIRVWRALATGYIEFFRGIPALLVVFAYGYAIPTAFEIRFSSVLLQISLALGMVSAAYIAETVRAGLQAVPKGQVEAARSLGMSSGATMRRIVIPQAFRMVLPPLTNEIVLLLKDTSLVFGLGLATTDYELTKVGRTALSSAGGGLTSILVIGIAYLLITIPLSALTRHLERTTGSKGHV